MTKRKPKAHTKTDRKIYVNSKGSCILTLPINNMRKMGWCGKVVHLDVDEENKTISIKELKK
jgi:hypothetical protein